MVDRIALIVDTKIVNRCHALELISSGGGIFHRINAVDAMSRSPFHFRLSASDFVSLAEA